jgi:hypothetical protein
MAIIASLRTPAAGPLAARLARRAGVGLAFQVIRAIPRRGLLALAAECLGLQLPILTPELFDVLFQRSDTPAGLGMHALPVARLLPQFEILAPQPGHLGTQRSDFLAALRDQPQGRSQAVDICARFEEDFFHDLLVLVRS